MSEFAIELMPNQIGCREEPPPIAADLDRKKQRDTGAGTVPPSPITWRATSDSATSNSVMSSSATGEKGRLNSADNVTWTGHHAAYISNAQKIE